MWWIFFFLICTGCKQDQIQKSHNYISPSKSNYHCCGGKFPLRKGLSWMSSLHCLRAAKVHGVWPIFNVCMMLVNITAGKVVAIERTLSFSGADVRHGNFFKLGKNWGCQTGGKKSQSFSFVFHVGHWEEFGTREKTVSGTGIPVSVSQGWLFPLTRHWWHSTIKNTAFH